MSSLDSRAKFKSHFLRLAEKRDIPSSDGYWELFWTSPKSAVDVFEGVTNNDIKTVCNTRNFVKLLRIVSLRLIYLADVSTDLNVLEILNCIRILTRLLPYFYENPIFVKVETQIFWSSSNSNSQYKKTSPDSMTPTVGTLLESASTYSNQDHDRASLDGNLNFENYSDVKSDKAEISLSDASAPLGAQLINTAVNLLFTRGFTLLPNGKGRNLRGVEFSIWEPGIGLVGEYLQIRPEIDCNRLEVLRFICTLCSQCMYNPPTTVVAKGSRYLTVLVAAVPKLHILALLSSLMNLVCRCSSGSDLENASNSNYNSTLTHLRILMATSLVQLLAMVIVYPLPKEDIEFLAKTGILMGKPYNTVRFYFGKLHKDQELNLIIGSLLALLESPLTALSSNEQSSSLSSLIKSKTSVPQPSVWAVETVMLLWELYQCNKKFKLLLMTEHGNRLLVVLLFHIHTFRKSELYLNLVRLCSYFLLFLTSDQILSSTILQPFQKPHYDNLPELFKISPSPVTYRDFAVAKICQLLISDDFNVISPTLNECLFNLIPLAGTYDPTATVLTQNRRNSASFAAISDVNQSYKSPGGGLSYSLCTLICQLMIKYSGHRFLTENANNPDYLAYLMRAMCQALCRFPKQSRSLIFTLAKNANYLENISITIDNMDLDESAELEEGGSGAGGSNSGGNGIGNGIGNDALNGRTTASSLETNSIQSVHSLGDDEVDPKYTSGEMVNSDDEDPLSCEIQDSLLRPKPPTGMSLKAKGKLPRDAPLKRTWTGHTPFNTILNYIAYIREQVVEFDNLSKADVSLVLNKIEHLELDKMIHSVAKTEYLASKSNFEQLKFIWTNLSLGWYESILMGSIFLSNETVSRRFSKSISLNNTISTFSKVSSDWGFGRWTNSESDVVDTVNKSLITTNIWFGTKIRLFKTDKYLAMQRGNFSEQLIRRFSDFKLNSGHSATAPPAVSRQNSTSSIQSNPLSSSPIILQSEDYFNDAVLGIKVTPRNSLHRLSVSSNLNSPRNLTRNNSVATTPVAGSPRNSISL